RRFAFEHRNRLRPQLRLSSHNGFGRKVRNENASERHGENQFSVLSIGSLHLGRARLQSGRISRKNVAALAAKERSLHAVHAVFVANAPADCTPLRSFRERSTSS